MRICIVGSRTIDDPAVVFPIIDNFIKSQVIGKPTVLSGGAKGVDSLAKKWSDVNGLDFIEFLPYHMLDTTVEFSSKYFFTRNRQMLQNADKVLAIWDEKSTGTLHAIRYCQKINTPVMVIKVPQK